MKKNLRLIGVPLDLGQSCRGVNMGPDAIRYAGLAAALSRLGCRVKDAGNIRVPIRDTLEKEGLASAIAKTSQATYALTREAVEKGEIPIILGGDHTTAIGAIGGVTHHGPCGVIWVDAHADFNTPESSPSGNIHGMSLSVLLGQGLPELVNCGREGPKLSPKDVVIVGVREIDPLERIRLAASGITVFTMRDVDEEGMSTVARKAIFALAHQPRIHVSLDMDALSPERAPGVGTPVPGGLSYREAHLLMEILADTCAVASMEIVEINPIMDTANQTAILAVHLAVSLFGKKIL